MIFHLSNSRSPQSFSKIKSQYFWTKHLAKSMFCIFGKDITYLLDKQRSTKTPTHILFIIFLAVA